MSTSASAGGGFMGPPLKKIVTKHKIASAIAASFVVVYAVWEVRVRASAKAGKTPRTLTEVS